ncbi:hypothetical protein [Streptomyces alboniger]|uniref:Synthetase n=1 Tax=Streptomyces alboniger TaxID=132473 RepID=Q53740_STRAD|nr:hypothetical protein [Streptomyces alboniger]QEV21101.1 hypothetical protein CP975_29285 [Streptomyces alboniger]CAA63161.1 Synthetase [Streptomyces alboniger]
MTLSITLTRTPGEYLAAALDRPATAPAAVPVLDPTGRHVWPRRIAARLGLPLTTAHDPDRPAGPAAAAGDATRDEDVLLGAALTELRTGREEHLVVAVAHGDDHAFAHPAAVYALAKRARLLSAANEDDIHRTVRDTAPRFLTLVGPARLLDFGLVTRIRARFPALDVGVLYAHSAAKLSELVLKTLVYPEAPATADVLIAPLLKGDEPLRNGQLTVYPQDAVDAATFTRPAPRPGVATAEPRDPAEPAPMHRLFSVITHGSEDYLRLTSQDILCGLTPDPAEQAAARRESRTLPACMHGGDCVYPDARRWDPAGIPAQIVFANACLTLKLGTQLFGSHNRFTVAQRFLDSWAGTYIASPLLKDGTPGENLLFHYLLDEGATVGGAVRQVNDSLRRWGVDAPEVLVIGDPEARYAPAAARPVPDAVTCQEEPGRAEITFEGRLPAFTRVPLKDPDLREAHRGGQLRLVPAKPFGGKLPLYGTFGETADGEPAALVFGFQERRLSGTETSRTLTAAPRQRTAADRIVRAVERYENLAALDIKLDKTRSVLTDTANSLPAVARRTKDHIADLTQSEPLHRATERILANCARLDRHLLDTLLRLTETREYHFVEAYRPTYAVEEVRSPYGECRYCGEATHRYTSAHVLRPWLCRLLISCPVCGATQDTEDATVGIAIEGDAVLAPDSTTSLRARITNDGDQELDLLLGARITRGKPHGFRFALSPDRLTVPAGGTATSHLTITTGRPTSLHAMLLRFYAVGLGRIDFAGRDLRFR